MGDALITYKTRKGDKGQQSENRDSKIIKKDDKKHVPSYEGSVKSLKLVGGTSRTPEGDNSLETSTGEHKNNEGGGGNTLNRDNGPYSTPVEDKLSMQGP